MFRLHTFGGCYLERDGARLDTVSGRKALALLALLGAAGARGILRDRVLAFLWPESDDVRARTSLKQLVHSLRQQLRSPDALLASSELRLNPDVVTSDVGEFREAIAQGKHATAVQLHAGPFLDGFYLRGADEFERWVSAERDRLAHDYARALEALAEQATADGDVRAAVGWWRRLAAVEPLSGYVATGLMRALDRAGERSAALQHARVFQQFVMTEVGGPPDAAVADLAEDLQNAPPVAPIPDPRASGRSDGGQPGPDGAFAAGRTTIAVLPFANTSGDPADEPFTDGLTDELIGAISRVPGVLVTGRTSVFALKGSQLDARAIAESLGVGALLEGSVRRAGERIRWRRSS